MWTSEAPYSQIGNLRSSSQFCEETVKGCVEKFLKVAKRELAPYSGEIGLVIYSAVDTLTRNPVIFWGFNPGQNPNIIDPTHWTIEEALRRFPTQTESLLTQVWPNAKRGTCFRNGEKVYREQFKAGEAPYQRGTRCLLSAACQPTNGRTFPAPLVSNFLFPQTKSEREAGEMSNLDDIVNRCWSVHKAVFEIAEPKVLITTATVVEYIHQFKLTWLSPTTDSTPSGYSNWFCKKWRGSFKHGEMIVLQIPHMSYWGGCIEKERSREAVKWVAENVRQAISRP